MKQVISFLLLVLLCAVRASDLREISVFPADFQNGKYAFCEGHASPLYVSFRGRGLNLAGAGAQLVLTLPDFLELTAAHSVHPVTAETYEFTTEGNTVTVKLSPAFLKNIREKFFPWMGGVNLYFRAKPDTEGKRGNVVIAMHSGGQPDALTKTIHAASAGPLPVVHRKLKKFKVGSWYSYAHTAPDRKLFEDELKFWTDLCDRPFRMIANVDFAVKDKTRVPQILEEFEVIYLMHTELDTIVPIRSSYGLSDGSRPNVPKLLGADGQVRSKRALCPQYMITDPENIYWEKHIVEGIRLALEKLPGVKDICIDYESGPEDATCDACRAEFARQEKLEQVPSREEIRVGRPLHLAWRKFRERQRTQIIKRYYETVRKHFPELKQWMCTVGVIPGQDPLMGWSGIDPRSYDPYTDCFNNMLYCAGKQYADMLFYNLQELKKPLCPAIDPAETELRYYLRYTPDTVRQDIVVTAAAGCRGMSMFPADYFDAAYLTMFCDAFNAVAEAEDAYEKPAVEGKLRVDITSTLNIELMRDGKPETVEFPSMRDELRTMLHTDGTCYYASMFNYSNTSNIFCRIALPDYQGDGTVVDLLSRRQYTEVDAEKIRTGFLVKLPPNGTLLLKFGPYAHIRGTVSQQQLAGEEAVCRQALMAKAEFLKPQVCGKRMIQYVIGRSGKPVIQFCDDKSKIEFDPEFGGIVTMWHVYGIGPCVSTRFTGDNGFGDLQFHDMNPSIPKTIPFKLDRLCFRDEDSCATAEMSYTIQPDLDAGGAGNPLENLKIERKNILMDSQGSFRIVHTFTNQSDKPMTFGFRLKNLPIYRWKPGEGPKAFLADGTEIPKGTRTYVKGDRKIDWEHIGSPKRLDDISIIVREFDRFPVWYRIGGDFDALYCWSDDFQQTFEPLTSKFTLEPGQSRTFTLKLDVVDERKK